MGSKIIKQGIISASGTGIFANIMQSGGSGGVRKTDKTGQIYNTLYIGSVPAATIQSLAGQTLCFSYETSVVGARYSTEQGQTAWNQTRYGIHGACKIGDTQYYPFADQLNYSGGPIKIVMYWTIPTGGASYSSLTFSAQTFDKPASTNNEIWFIRNPKLEIASYNTPWIPSSADSNYVGGGYGLFETELPPPAKIANDWIQASSFIEI